MESEEHAQTCARHMQFFRILYGNRAKARGLAAYKAMMANTVLRPWQDALNDLVQEEVHARRFYWYVNEVSNTGKSYMASYLRVHHGAIVYTNSKITDIACACNMEPIVIFDLSRTQADKIDHICTCIEHFKNSSIFSAKYNSHMKLFVPPHVIIFANLVPHADSRKAVLSQDRWMVINL